MRLTINVHCETSAEAEAIIAHLGRMPSAELPVRVPSRDDDDEPIHPAAMPSPTAAPPKGRDAPPPTSRPMTGAQLLGWIGDQDDARAALRQVQSIGKKLGYSWQIKMWKPDQVHRAFRQLGGAS